MKLVVACMLLATLGCTIPKEMNPVYGTVTEVRVISAAYIDDGSGDATGNVVTGALFGYLTGVVSPTTGAIAGAVVADSGREEAKILVKVAGCRLTVQAEEKKLRIDACGFDLEKCALFKSGDPIKISRTIWGDKLSYTWERCEAEILPQ